MPLDILRSAATQWARGIFVIKLKGVVVYDFYIGGINSATAVCPKLPVFMILHFFESWSPKIIIGGRKMQF